MIQNSLYHCALGAVAKTTRGHVSEDESKVTFPLQFWGVSLVPGRELLLILCSPHVPSL